MNGEGLRYDGDRAGPRHAERLPYLEKLGLRSRPFVPERQGWLLARSPVLGELLDKLLEEDWQEVLLCSAAIDEIQPQLCALVAETLEEKYRVLTLQADLLMSAEELLHRLATALNLEEEAASLPEVMIHALTDYVVEAQGLEAEGLEAAGLEAEGRVQGIVLQVEDAHELSAEALSLLIMLAEPHEGEIPAKVMLWGDASLSARLRQAVKGRAAKAACVEIPAFPRETVDEYLAYCLAEAGYEGDLPFSEARLARLYEESGGIPSRLHRLAEEALNGTARERGLGLRFPLLHVSVAVALVLVLVGLNAGPLAEAGARAAASGSGGTRTLTVEPRPVAGAQSSRAAAGPAASSVTPAASAAAGADNVAATSGGTVAPAAENDVAGPPVINTTPLFEQRRAAAEGGQAANSAAPAPAPVTEAVAGPAPAGQAVQSLAVAPSQNTAVAPAPATAPAASGDVSAQHARLLALPEGQFVVQLFGSFSEAGVQDFIAGSGLGQGMYYFETRYQDKPWFVALRGAFESREAAEKAAAALPAALRQGTPWVRPVKDIQTLLKAP